MVLAQPQPPRPGRPRLEVSRYVTERVEPYAFRCLDVETGHLEAAFTACWLARL